MPLPDPLLSGRLRCTTAVAVRGGRLWLPMLILPGLIICGCSHPGNRRPESAAHTTTDPTAVVSRIDHVLAACRDGRRLDAAIHGGWQVVHGILAFGTEFPIVHEGREMPALHYLLEGGRLQGWVLRPGSSGVIAVTEPGSTLGQGHPDQWLGYLSQCGDRGISLDRPLLVGGRAFTIRDLLTQAQADIRPGQEATWTLMAFSTYLPPEAEWTASDGERWDLARIVAMEAAAEPAESACGGAHRLFGLTTAVRRRATTAGPAGDEAGPWLAARDRITDCIDRARRYQQEDGSFSTQYFERAATSPDVFAKLGATGHIFEFLAVAIDDEDLTAPWILRAADRLCTLLEQTADIDVECGALYHAAHGLVLYRQRLGEKIQTTAERAKKAGSAPAAVAES
jgi:hypothetical protein